MKYYMKSEYFSSINISSSPIIFTVDCSLNSTSIQIEIKFLILHYLVEYYFRQLKVLEFKITKHKTIKITESETLRHDSDTFVMFPMHFIGAVKSVLWLYLFENDISFFIFFNVLLK